MDGLGGAVRARRLDRGLTLVELAGLTDLSHPFLSQIENGRARPSMDSLYRIAHALGTTPQSFFGGEVDADHVQIVRHGRAAVVGGVADDHSARLLVGGATPFRVLEFEPLTRQFGAYYDHDGYETVYVINGTVEVDLDSELTTLQTGDSMSYPARRPHRHRSIGRGQARMLLIEASVAVDERSQAGHRHLLEQLR
ncbi:MAG TPA: XRE family transcriptional regulator [Ilumatobacteraceae bacterium]|nr:XRE family transcriptional regulator [Ilumatobacteraceae bacterium]